jgi:hypothetical protein
MGGIINTLINWTTASDQETAMVKERVRMTCAEHGFTLPENILIHCQSIRRDKKYGQSLTIVDGTDSKRNQVISRIKIDPNGDLLFLSKVKRKDPEEFAKKKDQAEKECEFIPFPASLNDEYLIHCYDEDEPQRENRGKAVIIHEETQKETVIDFRYPKMENGERYTKDDYNIVGWTPEIKTDYEILRMPEYDHRFKGKNWIALFFKRIHYGHDIIPCILCIETGKLRVAGNAYIFDYPYVHSYKKTGKGKDLLIFEESDEPNEEVIVNNMSEETWELDDLFTNHTGWKKLHLKPDSFDPY